MRKVHNKLYSNSDREKTLTKNCVDGNNNVGKVLFHPYSDPT